MKLSDLAFPLYLLRTNPPLEVEDSLIYIDSKNTVHVVDDKSIEGDTLSIRRLRMNMEGVKLFPLKLAIFFLGDFIKCAKPGQWFIDSNGKSFSYTKTRLVPLVFKEISKVLPSGFSAIIEAKGIAGRHLSLYPPREGENFAGFLQIKPHTYVLYGFFREKHKDTRKKI